MLSILSIDTSASYCSVALKCGAEIRVKRSEKPREHVRLVLPMVEQLLAEAAVRLPDLDAITFAQGPGSFTGLRIGFGVVQGLAFGAQLPVIPVSTLQLMAQRAFGLLKDVTPATLLIPALDARMEELYWGAYAVRDGVVQPVMDDALSPREKLILPDAVWSNFLEDKPDLCTATPVLGMGDGWQYRPELVCENGSLDSIEIHEKIGPDAEALLLIAEHIYRQRGGRAIEDVQPVYLRNTVSWKKRTRLKKADT